MDTKSSSVVHFPLNLKCLLFGVQIIQLVKSKSARYPEMAKFLLHKHFQANVNFVITVTEIMSCSLSSWTNSVFFFLLSLKHSDRSSNM